jgi:hypothetical protein
VPQGADPRWAQRRTVADREGCDKVRRGGDVPCGRLIAPGRVTDALLMQ